MKKLFSMFMTAVLAASLFCVAPALAEDPEGTVVIRNNNTQITDNAGFICNQSIFAAKTANAVVDSAMEGVDAIAITAPGGAHVRWIPSAGSLTAGGAYEVFAWNIGQKDSNETWRAGASVATRDQTAKYTIKAAGGKKTVRYIDQRTATGDGNGWVSLGTYIFDGNGADEVRIDKITGQNYSSYTYVDDMKFVPVASSEAKLLHAYTEISAAAAESDPVEYTTGTILTDETAVEGDRIVKRIPATASTYTVTLAATPGSVVTADGEETSTITGTVVPGTLATHVVTVTAGNASKTYTLVIDMESATEYAFTPQDGIATVRESITATTKGYYNVYIQTGDAATNGKNYVDIMSVDVWHAGLRENVVLDYGRHAYNGTASDESWVFAGKYYFDGAYAENKYEEKVVITKVTSGTGATMTLPSVKLVSAAADTTAAPFAGVMIQAGGILRSIPASVFDENKTYTMPGISIGTSMGVKPIVNFTENVTLRVNGGVTAANSIAWPHVGLGVTPITISVTANEKTETYTVYLNKYDSANDTECVGTTSGTVVDHGAIPLGSYDTGSVVKSVSDGSIRYTPSLKANGKHRIIVWKPAFTSEGNDVYGSKNQTIVIHTATGPVTVTKDWQSLPSQYVDLGVYTLGADAYVEMTKAADAKYLMAGTMYFIQQTTVTIDDVSVTEDELSGYAYTTNGDSINLTASISPYMKVGDIALESGVPTNIPLQMGENQVTITVYADAAYTQFVARYTFSVTCFGLTVGTEAEGVVKTGIWAPSEKDGYTAGRKAEYTTGGATVFFPASLWGEYEVSVWRVAESAAFTAKVNGAAAASVESGAAGWVSLGEYRFTESAGEGVTVTAAADTTVYIDAVRFMPKGEYIFTKAALNATETGYSVSFAGTKNTEGEETLRVMLAVYSGDQMKNITVENRTVEGRFEISDISIEAGSGDTVKAFLWKGMVPVCGAVTTP